MNGPKAVATVIVIVIVAAILYPTINAALPDSWDEAPYSIELSEGSIEVSDVDKDDMTFQISIPSIKFESNLPETIHDVRVEFLIGTKDCLISAGAYDIGDVPPEGEIEKTFAPAKIPVLYALAFAGNLQSGEDRVDLPFVLKTEMKYLDWMDTQLLDVSMSVKASGTDSEGTVTVTTKETTATANVSVVSDTGLVPALIGKLSAAFGPMLVLSGDGFSVQAALIGGNMVVSLIGSEEKTCLDAVKDSLKETGKITYSYGLLISKEFSVEGGAADAIVNAMAGFYNKGASA